MKKITSTIIFTCMLSFIARVAWAGEGFIDYTVQKRDCISKIARSFHQPAELIAAVNNIDVDKSIRPGDKLLIPVDPYAKKVVLKRGDNAWDIAKKYQISLTSIIAENNITDFSRLMPGDTLVLPTAQSEEEFMVPLAVPAAVAVVRAHHKPTLKVSYRGLDKLLWPVQGQITSAYGSRWGGEFHHGLDIAADFGTTIIAAASGKVIQAGYKDRIYGNAVMIDNGAYTFLYGHASAVLVDEGQEVMAGEVIAKIGDTGRSTGPHLHFEVRNGDETLNPLRLLP